MRETDEAASGKRLQALRQDYLRRLPEKLQAIAAGWDGVCGEPDRQAAIEALARTLHTLAGSAATFGCETVADIARRFEGLLKRSSAVQWGDAPLFFRQGAGYLQWLKEAAAVEGAADAAREADAWAAPPCAVGPAGPRNATERALLYVCDNDGSFADCLALMLAARGYAVETFGDVAGFESALLRRLPDAVIVDIDLNEGELMGGLDAAGLARCAGQAIPLLAVSASDDMQARLTAVRAGSCAYFTKPVVADDLARTLDGVCGRFAGEAYRIGIVDDDEVGNSLRGRAMEQQGMVVRSVADPLTVVQAFDRFQPDLIVIDVNKSGCNGLELAAVLRQLRRYDDVPMVFLTAESAFDHQLRTVQQRGDDCLAKPITAARLADAIRPRVKRARELRGIKTGMRRAMEESLQLQFALDQHAIVSMTDRAGDITFVNDNFCRISGYSRAELIGNNHRIVKGDHEPEVYADLWRTIAAGKVWHGELRNRCKDGRYYWVETTIVPVKDETGRFSRYISIRTDITHLQAVQEAMASAKEQAERASRAKSEFLSRVSHELRTPLNAILGFAQVLRSDPDEPLSEEQKGSVEQILTAGWHLLELINEVLDLSGIESGKTRLRLEEVPLGEVLEECLDLMAPLAEQRGILMREDIEGCADIRLWADRTRLKQVLLNLLSNAVKYNREGGGVHIACERAGHRLRIAVADQGAGLSAEQLKCLFEPFNRFGAECSGVEGTGIGLVITKGLVGLMGGVLEVSSQPGVGSVFSVLLPRAADDDDAGRPMSLSVAKSAAQSEA